MNSPAPIPLVEQLYRALRLYGGCGCEYKRVNGIPFWENGERVLMTKCTCCKALERYESEVGKPAEVVER